MASTKNATYKIYNGTDWDTVYFKTSAAQVGESNGTLNFLRPSTHTVNGKSFWSGSAHQGITLYGSDIKITSSATSTVADAINTMTGQVQELYEFWDMMDATSIPVDSEYLGITQMAKFENLAEFAQSVDGALEDINTSIGSGYVPVNSSGKIDLEYFPDTILGQVNYAGLFNANANECTLSDTDGTSLTLTMKLPTKSEIASGGLDDLTYYIPTIGDYFIITTAGTFDSISLSVGDWLIYNGVSSGWGKIDNTDAVSSVAGLTGAITAANLVSKLKGTTSTTLAVGNHTHNYAGSSSPGGAATIALQCTGNAATASRLESAFMLTIGSKSIEVEGTDDISFTMDDITANTNYRKVYVGSATPTDMRTGDIWISY